MKTLRIVGLLLPLLLILAGCCSSCPRGPVGNSVTREGGESSGGGNLSVAELQPNYALGVTTTVQQLRLNRLDPVWLARNGESVASQLNVLAANGISLENDTRANIGKVKLDPITIGFLIAGLRKVIDDIELLVRDASAEIKAIGAQLQQNAQNLITDLNTMFEDRLDQLITALNDLERRIAEDAEATLERMQIAARELAANAMDAARVALYEADITAYNALGNLPCKPHEARLVYCFPAAIRVGQDRSEVKVRGNFLNYGPANVRIEGRPAEIIGVNANEYTLRLPQDLLESIGQERSISISATPPGCKPGVFGHKLLVNPNPTSTTLVIKPRVTYQLTVIITPKAELPYREEFKFQFYDIDNNCDADRRVDKNWCLPPKWQVVWEGGGVRKYQTTANCGSDSAAPEVSGDRCVLVPGRLKGCGYNWFGLNCKGRGWLGYDLYVLGKTYRPDPLPTYQEVTANAPGTQRTFTYDYPHVVPPDHQNLQWTYDVQILVQEGSGSRPINLSDGNPNAEGVVTRITPQGKLTVELPPNISLR